MGNRLLTHPYHSKKWGLDNNLQRSLARVMEACARRKRSKRYPRHLDSEAHGGSDKLLLEDLVQPVDPRDLWCRRQASAASVSSRIQRRE